MCRPPCIFCTPISAPVTYIPLLVNHLKVLKFNWTQKFKWVPVSLWSDDIVIVTIPDDSDRTEHSDKMVYVVSIEESPTRTGDE